MLIKSWFFLRHMQHSETKTREIDANERCLTTLLCQCWFVSVGLQSSSQSCWVKLNVIFPSFFIVFLELFDLLLFLNPGDHDNSYGFLLVVTNFVLLAKISRYQLLFSLKKVVGIPGLRVYSPIYLYLPSMTLMTTSLLTAGSLHSS